MSNAYYYAKPELFPPGDLNDPEVVHHIAMLNSYLTQTAQFIHDLYGSDLNEIKILALGALRNQVLSNPNDVIYEYLKGQLGISEAQINTVVSQYISGGHRCD